MLKKEKIQKNKKHKKDRLISIMAKPIEAMLKKSTDLTLSYLYEYSKTYYNESLSYDDWLVSVREFMKLQNVR